MILTMSIMKEEEVAAGLIFGLKIYNNVSGKQRRQHEKAINFTDKHNDIYGLL